MAISYRPKAGEILTCDFGDKPVGAEMCKRRPVVVVSRKDSHGRGLATVVPISTTAPDPVRTWHHALPDLVIEGWPCVEMMWAKCDMVSTVSFERLHKPYRKTRHGREYIQHVVRAEDLDAIRQCLRSYFVI